MHASLLSGPERTVSFLTAAKFRCEEFTTVVRMIHRLEPYVKSDMTRARVVPHRGKQAVEAALRQLGPQARTMSVESIADMAGVHPNTVRNFAKAQGFEIITRAMLVIPEEWFEAA